MPLKKQKFLTKKQIIFKVTIKLYFTKKSKMVKVLNNKQKKSIIIKMIQWQVNKNRKIRNLLTISRTIKIMNNL